MTALRSVCFALFCFVFLWSCAMSHRRPLGDFIKHYETLDYDTTRVVEQHNRVRRSSPKSDHRIEVNLKSSQREFKIRLKRDTNLFTDDFQVDNADFDPAKVVTGDVKGHKKSLVHGFISDDGVFEGKIYVGNDEYFVESAKQYFKDAPQDFHSIIYESRDVHYPHAYGPGCGVNEKTKEWMDGVKRSAVKRKVVEKEHDTAEFDGVNYRYRRATQSVDPQKLSCTLKMRADHLFTVNMADGNKERAMLLMVNHVKAATAVYKNTGFAQSPVKPEGIQFQIQRMSANDSSDATVTSNPYRFNNIGVQKLLEINSEENHDDVCLAYVFTYRDFADGALGLAWMGESAPGEAICGNRVVEKGEQCDCGFATDNSCTLDKCCQGRSGAVVQEGDCKLLPGKSCSPSEGSCCSDGCIPQNTSFLCHKETECTDSTYCNGINATCAVQQKPNLTECNYGRQVCLEGECSGSICLKYGLLGCQCKNEEHLCHICCKDGQNGECKPTKDIPNMKNENLRQFPGAPCNDFNGHCDQYLKCRVMVIDGPTNHAKAIHASMLKAIVAFVAIIVHELT